MNQTDKEIGVYLNDEDRQELQERQRMASMVGFMARLIAQNTALIPAPVRPMWLRWLPSRSGKLEAKRWMVYAQLADQAVKGWVSSKLTQLGFAKDDIVNIDSRTGKISKQPQDEARS